MDEGDVCDGYISLKDIATIEDCEYNIEKPQCLMITLVCFVNCGYFVDKQESLLVCF